MDGNNEVVSQHSGQATTPIYVQFHNVSDRFVDVVWIDYHGHWVRYETMAPRASYDVFTYVSHPWIFLDSSSGCRVHALGRGPVYCPQVEDIQRHRDPDGFEHILPTVVFVGIPVYSLKDRCCEVICQEIDERDQLQELHLPTHLVRELTHSYDRPSNHMLIDAHFFNSTEDESSDTENHRTTDASDQAIETNLSDLNEVDHLFLQTHALHVLEAIMAGDLLVSDAIAITQAALQHAHRSALVQPQNQIPTEETVEPNDEEVRSESPSIIDNQDESEHSVNGVEENENK